MFLEINSQKDIDFSSLKNPSLESSMAKLIWYLVHGSTIIMVFGQIFYYDL